MNEKYFSFKRFRLSFYCVNFYWRESLLGASKLDFAFSFSCTRSNDAKNISGLYFQSQSEYFISTVLAPPTFNRGSENVETTFIESEINPSSHLMN